MNKEKLLGIVRHILTFGGGLIVANGTLEDSVVQEGIGAIISIVGIVLSLYAKDKKVK